MEKFPSMFLHIVNFTPLCPNSLGGSYLFLQKNMDIMNRLNHK